MQSYYPPVVFVTSLVGDVAVFSAADELVNCAHGKTGLVEADDCCTGLLPVNTVENCLCHISIIYFPVAVSFNIVTFLSSQYSNCSDAQGSCAFGGIVVDVNADVLCRLGWLAVGCVTGGVPNLWCGGIVTLGVG
jgi:hypothetical protein